ncbi:MAG: helix-turn-helix domain-containing protein [Gammaproteobacteria bacterium]|nr:helix-turn-helix domain-containing protein [Gammaproteobacteria bacterium]
MPVDPEKATALRRLVEAGMTPGKAARQLGIGWSTAYRLIRESEDNYRY